MKQHSYKQVDQGIIIINLRIYILVDNNRIRIQSSGNMESTVSKSLGGSFSAKGFSLSFSTGDTQTWRKVVTLDKQIKLH